MGERKPYGVKKEMKNKDRFKFRVWDKGNEKYIYDAVYAYDGNSYKGKGDNLGHIYCFGEYLDDQEGGLCVVEQCTGLKDKNGKLIYEGDIVKKYTFIDYEGQGCEPDNYLDKVDIGIVYITASKGVVLRRVKTLLTKNPYKEKELLPKEKRYKATRLVACRSEVIGNIHESPELLEK